MVTSPSATPQPKPSDEPVPDPSMEDILASIRRILNEDEAPKPAPEPDNGTNGVLVLDDSMMVPETPEPPPREAPPRATDAPPDRAEALPEPRSPELGSPESRLPEPRLPEPRLPEPRLPEPGRPPEQQRLPESEPPALMQAAPDHPPEGAASGLVAPAAAAAAGASVDELMRTLVSERSTAVQRGGPTIEDLVRAEIRPLLKQWLDIHLPPVVERLVRTEIERVVGRMAP